MFVCVPVHSFFSLLLIFTLVATSISHFLTPAIKFSCFSSIEMCLLLPFISCSCSFSVIHISVDVKIESKKRLGFVAVFSL